VTAVERSPEPLGEAGRGTVTSEAKATPDPWGVRRAEELITSLEGVLSARVVVSPMGEVTEVHVLTRSGVAPKRVVRNIESALVAQLGIKIDHRRISVAQTADVRPIEVLEKSAVRREARKRGLVFKRAEVRPSEARPHRVMVTVTLTLNDEDVSSEEETADAPTSRLAAAARATVAAIDRILPSGTMALEGCTRVDAFGRPFAFVGVQMVGIEGMDRAPRLLTGTCEIKDQQSSEQSAALAVLDATNRWLHSYW